MPYLTLTENLKLQLSPGLVASYDIEPGNGVGLFWDKHTHVYLLTQTIQTITAVQYSNKTVYYISIFKTSDNKSNRKNLKLKGDQNFHSCCCKVFFLMNLKKQQL